MAYYYIVTPLDHLGGFFWDVYSAFHSLAYDIEGSGGLFDWLAPHFYDIAYFFLDISYASYDGADWLRDRYNEVRALYETSTIKELIAAISYDFWLLVNDPAEFFRQLFMLVVPGGSLFLVDPVEWVVGRIYDRWPILMPLFTDPLYWVKHLFYDYLPWTYPLFDRPLDWLRDKITSLIWNGDILIDDPGRWMRLKLYADYPWLSPIFEAPWEWIEMRIVQQWPILRGLFDWPDIWVRHRLEELQPGLGLLIDDPVRFLWERFVDALELFWPDNTDWLQDIGERILLVLWEGG